MDTWAPGSYLSPTEAWRGPLEHLLTVSLTDAPFGGIVATRHRYESQRDNSCLITAVISVGRESPPTQV